MTDPCEQGELIPPAHLVYDGSHNLDEYRAVGEAIARLLIRFGLRPHHRVLEVGSGIGRNAVPLTRYLNGGGCYEGFDIMPAAVGWCAENITPRFPHFRFQIANLRNGAYNPRGEYTADQYRFPYAKASFDIALLASVFTHMLPPDLENYLAEVARVLAPGGRCFISYFLLNAASRRGLEAGWSALQFPVPYGNTCRLADPCVPESAVAYDEQYLLDLYRANGLQVEEPILYGKWWWWTAEDQDLISASKPST